MYPRTEYEMSEKDLEEILNACKPTPCISFGGGSMGASPQENANNAWERLGLKMGFDSMSVRPSNKGQRFFTAIPSETEQQKKERLRKEDKEKKLDEINTLEKEIKEKQEELDKRTVNLCPECADEPPTCESNPKFGLGIGNDNVYECDSFIKKDS